MLGKVYSLGRSDYGRLGLGKEAKEEKSAPMLVSGIETTSDVACGASVSFAVTREGEVASKDYQQALCAHTNAHIRTHTYIILCYCFCIVKG